MGRALALVVAMVLGATPGMAAEDSVPGPIPPGSVPGPRPVWIHPRDGDIIGEAVPLLVADGGFAPPGTVTGATFHYSRDGLVYTPIATARSSLFDYRVDWDAAALAPGPYVLKVILTTALGEEAAAVIGVHLNRPPRADAALLQLARHHAVFDAGGSRDEDGEIDRYEWRFGDGSAPVVTRDPEVAHRFTGHGPFGVALTAIDGLGGEGTSHYVVDLLDGTQDAKRDCGCKEMRVKFQKDRVKDKDRKKPAIEGDADLEFRQYIGDETERRSLGPYTARVEHKGKTYWDVFMRFEVIAELKPLSLPSACAEGQRVQGVRTSGGQTYPVGRDKKKVESADPAKTPPQDAPEIECPLDGEKWCDDGFHAEYPKNAGWYWKKHDKNQDFIWWIDLPGFQTLPESDLPARADLNFHAKVTGERGTCACTWKVLIENFRINDGKPTFDEFSIPTKSVKCTSS